MGQSVPIVTPKGLYVTSKGRILFVPLTSEQVCVQQLVYSAPEYRLQETSFSDTELEKMWIYSVGVSIQSAASSHSLSQSLHNILKSMTHPDSSLRASLMDLLDVISEYCKSRGQTKPFSHVVMDLFNEATTVAPSCSSAGTWPRTITLNPLRTGSGLPAVSYLNGAEPKRHPVQRAPSRLYRADTAFSTQDKYHCPTTCIGPEFVVRAANPPRIMHLGDVKPVLRRRLVVILLNGQKLEITCDPNSTTAAQIFEVVVESEGITENFTLGLAMLVSGDFVYLPADIRLCKVAPSAWSGLSKKQPYYSFTLYLRVKFYLPSLRGLRSWSWKHLLYLQLRHCLLERQLRCETKEMMSLAGLALQAEFGDFNPEEHGCGDYFLLEHYLPEGMWREGENVTVKELQGLHTERRGLDPGKAEELFIASVQRLIEYGTHFYSAISVNKDHLQNEVWLGVNGEGISICLKNTCSTYAGRVASESFKWRDIKKLSYNKQHFELTTQTGALKYKFKMDTNKSFCVFRLASQHHKFFLKLRAEMTSIQNLAEEFGVPVTRNEKDVTKTVYYVGSTRYTGDGKPIEHKPSFLKRSASFFSPERVIFRGKTASHCVLDHKQSQNRSEACNDSGTDIHNKSDENVLESNHSQNIHLSKSGTLPGPWSATRKLDFSGSSKTVVSCGRRGLGVRMGTRTFLGSSNIELDTSLQSNTELDGASSLPPTPSYEVASSVSEYSPAQSPLPEAYVLNSSIKTVDDRFHVDFQETISESLAEKFNNIPFIEERILTTVRLSRDKNGSIGVQITEGRDGGVYVQSVAVGGPAHKLGLIHKGDHIQAVDGKNILSVPYNEALRTLQDTGEEIELVLSQVYRGQETRPHSHTIDYTPGETTGMDLHATIVQKPIEESYFKVIRYETATEAEGNMIDTALPKSENKSNVFLPHQTGTPEEGIPPTPAPRLKKKKKKIISSYSDLNDEEVKTDSLEDFKIIPPPRQKCRSVSKTPTEIKSELNEEGIEHEIKEIDLIHFTDISKDEPTMSATIVDILYKPNHNDIICLTSQECTFLKENHFQLSVSEENLDPLVNYNSSFNISLTNNNNVPNVSNIKEKKIKDTEENDSGVYFSDTKSSPENVKPIWQNSYLEEFKLGSENPGMSITSKCLHNSDSSDNNETENLGPQNFTDNKFGQMLDSFEAQTVSAFREDILNRFDVREQLYEKQHIVENWLNVNKQKSVSGSGLSEYLQCMLQTESDDASSFQCSSAVEEGNRSDDNKGSKVAEETVETINVFRNIDKNLDTTSIDGSQDVDFIVENNNSVFVNNLFVNNDVYNSQCLDCSSIIVKSVEDNVVCNESKIEYEIDDFCSVIKENMFGSPLKPVIDDLEFSSKERNIYPKPLNSPIVELGTVKNLVDIFENVKCMETSINQTDTFNEISEITEYIIPPPILFSDGIDQNLCFNNNQINFVGSVIGLESDESSSIIGETIEFNQVICDSDNEESTCKEIDESKQKVKEDGFILPGPVKFNSKLSYQKPTTIPIVLLAQGSQAEKSFPELPVGIMEIHSVEDSFSTDLCNQTFEDITGNRAYNFECKEVFEVVLEKVNNNLGIQIEGETEEGFTVNVGLIISDILPGGAADTSGLINKGASSKQKQYGSSGL